MHWLLLFALVAMWGSSFMFTKVAVSVLPPTTVVAARLTIAAAVLGSALAMTRPQWPVTRRLVGFLVAMAVIGNAFPFWLISWGQQHIASGLAGILMAVMPLATAVLAHVFVEGECLSGIRTMGFALGFGGIVVLMGPGVLLELRGEGTALIAELAVLGGALCYAVNAIIARRRPSSDPLLAATGVAVAASLVMMPFAVAEPPAPAALSLPVAAAVCFLGLISTALATIVYFKLVTVAGPSFLSLINYFIPLWAVAMGFIVLDEQPEWRALAALGLVLSGVALSQIPAPPHRHTG